MFSSNTTMLIYFNLIAYLSVGSKEQGPWGLNLLESFQFLAKKLDSTTFQTPSPPKKSSSYVPEHIRFFNVKCVINVISSSVSEWQYDIYGTYKRSWSSDLSTRRNYTRCRARNTCRRPRTTVTSLRTASAGPPAITRQT